MATSPTVTEVKVEDFVFPSSVKPPGSDKSFFLGGAGVRGMEIGGRFIKFTAIGVYLEESGLLELAPKWKAKSVTALVESHEFFRDIVTGPFEKFTQVTTILPLTGQQYADKVTENCVKFWKAVGIYTDEEAKAVDKFIEVFKDENFPPGHSIMFTQSPSGSLTVAFSKHESIPQDGKAVIENKNMSEAVLESIIGKHGVSPETKQSLAARVSALLNDQKVEDYVFPPMVKPPGSDKTFFLAGAGERGRSDIDGTYVKYTAIGVYLEDDAAIQALAPKWKGKTAAELTDSVEFIRDVITGPFEKFTQVTMIQPLTGHQYSVNMAKWFEDIWRSQGIFTDSEAKALQTYLEVFDDKKFSPGDSILFTQAPTGKFTIGFSKHDNIPKDGVAVIQNTTFPQQILISMIGENGVCPGARQTLAARMSELLK